jgi:hypothetical protein
MDRMRQQDRVMTATAVVFLNVLLLRESGAILHFGDLFCTGAPGLHADVTDATGGGLLSSVPQKKSDSV